MTTNTHNVLNRYDGKVVSLNLTIQHSLRKSSLVSMENSWSRSAYAEICHMNLLPDRNRPTKSFAFMFMALSILLLILVSPLKVRAQGRDVEINYGGLVDTSQVTHSGATVKQVLEQLSSASTEMLSPLSPNTPSPIDIEAEIAAYRRQIEALKKQLVQGSITLQEATSKAEAAKLSLEMKAKLFAAQKRVANLSSLVEPFLEPYAFLLEDALEVNNPNEVKRRLIDVGDLFREGEPQPAWANLLKTRRYFVLSDGKGFVRMFIPGNAAESAYRENYGVSRQVLAWLLSSDAPATHQLNVEVYSYENDFSSQTLKLHTSPYNFQLDAAPTPKAGTVPLDLESLDQFLKKGLTLEGAYINNEGSLVLYGSEQATKPMLDGQPLSLSDLAVAYRAVFYAGHGDAYISLDRSKYPEQVNVNFGGRLADTRMGWVVLRSDMRFKTLSNDFDPVTGERMADSIRRSIPDFLTRMERLLRLPMGQAPSFEATRFWYYPDSVTISTSNDRRFMKISSPRFTGAAERQEASSGTEQLSRTTPPWTRDTLAHLNRNYGAFARVFPELRELDEVGRLLALFTWLKQKQQAGELKLDLDSLLNVELPKCSTPRQRYQLLVGYIKKGNQIIPVNLSDITEGLAISRPHGNGMLNVRTRGTDLPTTEMEIIHGVNELLQALAAEEGVSIDSTLAVIGGGIDLDLSKTVARAKRLPPSEEILYSRLRQAPPETPIVTTPGRRVFRSDARVGESLRAYQPPAAKPHQLAAEQVPLGNGSLRESRVADTGREVATYGDSERPQWVRQSERNPLSSESSRTVHLGSNGSTEAFTRFEQGELHHYKLARGENRLVAEPVAPAGRAGDAAVVNGALRQGESTTQAWRYLPEDTQIAAIERAPDGRVAILERQNESYKLTYFENGRPVSSVEGNKAISELEEIARNNVGGGSTDDLSFVHASSDGDNVLIMVGKRRKTVTASEMENLLNDPHSPDSKALDDLFTTEAGTPEREFVVYRDALTRRPERYGGSLKAGNVDDPVRIAVALRERFEGSRIYLDDEVQTARQNRQAIAPIRSSSDLGVLAPEESFGVEDYDLLRKIKRQLSDAGIRVFDSATSTQIPNILLISGHNNENLVRYLTSIGESGFLRGKVLILNTCYTANNPNLAHDLIQRYGARAVYLHTETIRPVALKPVMDQLGQMLKTNPQENGIHPAELLDRAIDRVLQDTSLPAPLRHEIIKLRLGVLQISAIRSKSRLRKTS